MIHWQYIKGAYQTSSTDIIPYTFLDFAGAYDSNNQEGMLPTISIANTNAHPNSNLGHIMVSGIEQTFESEITFTSGIYTDEIKDITTNHRRMLQRYNDNLNLGVDFDYINIGHGQSAIAIDGDCTISTFLNINGATAHLVDGAISAKSIYSDSICEAQYFNATSDRRAKTDIKPISQSVLPLVINTQLYSFKYKDLDTPSIGIIAQDVQDVNFDGFSLVDNKEATGQDMDYMSIHESKLIYVLWKAVQEQQKEIEELKAQIKKGL